MAHHLIWTCQLDWKSCQVSLTRFPVKIFPFDVISSITDRGCACCNKINISFCDTSYNIFSKRRTLMCIVSWDYHSLSIGTFSVVSDLFLWFLTILMGVFTVPFSLCSSAQWCIFFQLWFYQLPHQVLMLWFTSWLHSSLFLLPICRRSVHCLIHIKQPDANFCCLFLVSIFPSSWLTLWNKQCSTMETVGFYVITN